MAGGASPRSPTTSELGNSLSEIKSSAFKLDLQPRIGLGVLGVLCLTAVGLVVVLRQNNLPDLLLAALAICGLISLALCIVGRLPSGFEVAGMQVDFTVDNLSDLLGTIRGLDDVDPDARERVVELIKSAAAPDVFEDANSRYGNDQFVTPAATAAATTTGAPLDEPVEAKVLKTLHGISSGPILERQEVEKSGKGKNPKFDYQFEIGSGTSSLTVVCQLERYWNPSSVDLLKRKLLRALQKSTIVSRAIIVVPRAGLATVRAAVAGISGVLVVPEEHFENPRAAQARLKQALAQLEA